MSDIGPNIAKALSAFQGEMPKVAKGKTARVPMKAGGSYSYKYADLADVTEAAAPILSKNGLAFTACPEENAAGRFVLVGTLAHESGESISGTLPLHGGTEQAMGSSLTYARRYLLGCLTGIVTDDDEDGEIASNTPREPLRSEPTAPTDPHEAVLNEIAARAGQLGTPLQDIVNQWAKDHPADSSIRDSHDLEGLEALRDSLRAQVQAKRTKTEDTPA